MGLMALALPAMFANNWPVIVLSAMTMLAMTALRKIASLRNRLGLVICGVERRSLGEFYFPLGVGSVFCLSNGDRVLYSIPVLVLALADAAAALVGEHYGRLRFRVIGGCKSVEGSLAFFAVSFLSVFLSLLLFKSQGEAALIALGVSSALTIVEALAWRGNDNALIPVCGFFLLRMMVS
jgi:phytol kinase